MSNECRSCCKGSAPYFLCRDRGCICHLAKHLEAIKTPNRLGHADRTADTAVKNIMRGNKKWN